MDVKEEIDVKEAVIIAIKYFSDLFSIPAQELDLEEVELDESSHTWRVTVGYQRPDPLGVRMLSGQERSRVYKVVTVDAAGNASSVKMRH